MRFFHASAMAGRLHLLDIGDFGLWQPERIAYWDEATVDSLAERMFYRKARTVEDLDPLDSFLRVTPVRSCVGPLPGSPRKGLFASPRHSQPSAWLMLAVDSSDTSPDPGIRPAPGACNGVPVTRLGPTTPVSLVLSATRENQCARM